VRLGVAMAVGSVAGAALLAVSSRGLFRAIVPALVLAACLLLAIQPWVTRWLEARGRDEAKRDDGGPAMLGLSVVAGAYGAYFGAALGVLLLALLGTLVQDTLQRLNALKGLLSLIANWLAAGFFIAFAPVHWEAVAALAPASLIGGRAGVVVARRLPDAVLRALVVAFGTGVAIYLFASG
jgi:uncharacterized protein